eukprot:1188487-Prorocentrum_minimum.AAC.4
MLGVTGCDRPGRRRAGVQPHVRDQSLPDRRGAALGGLQGFREELGGQVTKLTRWDHVGRRPLVVRI